MGYRLVDPDGPSSIPETLRFDKLASTNDVVMRLGGKGAEEHTIVVAREQTGSRGGTGSWHAPRGGLWLSTLWEPQLDACSAARLTLAGALGVREGIRRHTGIEPGLKWPNDLVVDGDKLGGVLVEGQVDGHDVEQAAIGIGINVNNPTAELPEDVRDEAVALHAIANEQIGLEELGDTVAESLARARRLVHEPAELVRSFEASWTQKGAEVRIDAGHMVYEGEAVGIDSDGALLLDREGDRHRVEDPSLAKFVRIVGDGGDRGRT
jgi:BirA family biotin operon repressor/biotin-[acetyl-CoA-carboxylase] ligase